MKPPLTADPVVRLTVAPAQSGGFGWMLDRGPTSSYGGTGFETFTAAFEDAASTIAMLRELDEIRAARA